ncbi:MAG: amidase [Alphaproteobacteria bacterium]|nr:amidase [Alphaproteobacteria bacterium]
MSDMFGQEVSGFLSDARVPVEGAVEGPLKGLTFAVKDIIDVAGHVTGGGNAEWLRTHEPADQNASAVQFLLDAGATMAGKTITEEFAYGMIGENFHYGTPRNAAAPGRIPGGSSSGSASVVSAGEVDFALGTDTGGSVRVPASFCGIYGLRPSHGRVPLAGILPLAPSLDTCGWFARDPDLMKRVGEVMLDWRAPPAAGRFLVARDAFAVVDAQAREALAPALRRAAEVLGAPQEIDAGALHGIDDLSTWAHVMQVMRGSEAAASHLAWIGSVNPVMGPGFRERFEDGGRYTSEEIARATATRARIEGHFDALLADGAVLAVPAAPAVPPPVRSPESVYDTLRGNNERYNSMAPLARLPQISLPLGRVDGLPIGLGLMAAHGNDELLLDIAVALGSPQ